MNDVLKAIAIRVNLSFATNDTSVCSDAMIELYKFVQQNGGECLINLLTRDLQPVGLAFTSMALYFSATDTDINSVAAENAYYLLARSYIETENQFILPALFSLMQNTNLMKDKLIASWSEIAQKEIGMPIVFALGGNPFSDPKLADFREQAISFSKDIQMYLLSNFFDLETLTYKVSKDLRESISYHIPSYDVIMEFMNDINSDDIIQSIKNGEKHFISVYNECRKTLINF